ncbi:MAG: BatA domain-containing protein [Christensenellales bacterium]
MSILLPLGLLGLLGIAVLILIYILKPNYQQKLVSSTYIWELSLKYRKKKIPISRLRNLIILICQLLIIAACAMILAQPVIRAEKMESNERIALIDASAGMLATDGADTRFVRAIGQVKELAEETFSQSGIITVILVDEQPAFIARRADQTMREELMAQLDELARCENNVPVHCTYGVADIDAGMELAEQVLEENPTASVRLYTGKEFIDSGIVDVIDVGVDTEWNAAIVSASAEMDENFYSFSVEVASYGIGANLRVNCEVYGVNGQDRTEILSLPARCDVGETVTVEFNSDSVDMMIYMFDYVRVSVEAVDAGGAVLTDSFSYDDTFYLYGGTPQKINIQYASPKPNPFVSGILIGLRDSLSSRWDIDLTEVRGENAIPEIAGFDFYIFEHKMPEILPTDGVVFLINPDVSPEGAGITLNANDVSGDFTLRSGGAHPITDRVNAEEITVSKYKRVTLADGFETLLYIGNDPALMIKNEPGVKIALLTFSLNSSNFSVLAGFPSLMYNMISYFFPSTITDSVEMGSSAKYIFEVNDTVTLNAKGPFLTVTDSVGTKTEFDEFPAGIEAVRPGTYTVSQIPLSGVETVERFYVRIAAAESDIGLVLEELYSPYVDIPEQFNDFDLLLYFAIALVALEFIEWILQTREHF